MTYFIRTENGVAANVTKEAGLAEANLCMMAGKREVAEMTAVSGFYDIRYKDGRKVTLSRQDGDMPAPARQTVTVKGKRYIVSAITPARPKTEGATSWIPEAYVSYWAERNGEIFGATRTAKASMKPGSIGRAIWDALNQ